MLFINWHMCFTLELDDFVNIANVLPLAFQVFLGHGKNLGSTALAFSQMLGSIIAIIARPAIPQQQVFSDFALWNIGPSPPTTPLHHKPWPLQS